MPRAGVPSTRGPMAHLSFRRGLFAAAFLALHAQAQQVCVSPPSGLFSWWDGDAVSLTTVFDTQGSNNGILTSGTTTAVGKVGRAFSFDGIDDEVTIADQQASTLSRLRSMLGYFRLHSMGSSTLSSTRRLGRESDNFSTRSEFGEPKPQVLLSYPLAILPSL